MIRLRPFTAPEALDREYGPASDIWVFGLAILQAVTQEEPYGECQSPLDLMAKLAHFEPPELMKKVEDELLLDLIGRCLRRTSARPSAKALMQHEFFRQRDGPGKLSRGPMTRSLGFFGPRRG